MKGTLIRSILGLAMAILFTGSAAFAHTNAQAGPTAPDVVYQSAMPLADAGGDASLLGIVINFAPGQGFPVHTHGGPLVVQVLEGAITLRENDMVMVYKAGESWTEMPGHQHSAVNEGTTNARVWVSALLPKGAELTTVVPGGTTPPAVTVPYQVALPVSPAAGEASIVGVVLDFPQGAGVPEHVHGGPLVVQVLSGAVTLTEDGVTKTYKAGESWTEMPGHPHSAINNNPETARVALAAILPKGADLTTVISMNVTPAGMPSTGSPAQNLELFAFVGLLLLTGGYLIHRRRHNAAS